MVRSTFATRTSGHFVPKYHNARPQIVISREKAEKRRDNKRLFRHNLQANPSSQRLPGAVAIEYRVQEGVELAKSSEMVWRIRKVSSKISEISLCVMRLWVPAGWKKRELSSRSALYAVLLQIPPCKPPSEADGRSPGTKILWISLLCPQIIENLQWRP